MPNLVIGRYMAAMATIENNTNLPKTWISGGRNPKTKKLLDSIEFLDEENDRWNISNIRLPKPDAGHSIYVVTETCKEVKVKKIGIIYKKTVRFINKETH